MRQILVGTLLALLSATFLSCKETTSEPTLDQPPKFTISADQTWGSPPFTVHFTGTFSGKIDTIETPVPACILFPGVGRTIVPYWLTDSVQPAKAVYYDSCSYIIGTYRATMRLYTKHKTYDSDTLTIIVK
jgi:hypothetical protein